MAVDEAILESTSSGNQLPTLRLYAWEPACLSIGYAQPTSDVNFAALKEHGWDLVRRPTGGRAILHKGELTYAVTGPSSDPRLKGGVLESYKRLSKALLMALNQLGAPAQAFEKTRLSADQNSPNPVCFEIPSNYEITVGGKKLIGSAQARKREGILQHGSLPLFGDITTITDVLRFSNNNNQTKAARRLSERATTLESILGYTVTWEEVASKLCIAFQDVLDIKLEPSELSQSEIDHTAELENDKYNNPEWTRKVRVQE